MNYCNICKSNYTYPGTCNCFAPVRTWTTAGATLTCPSCGKYPCAGTSSGCPLPSNPRVTVSEEMAAQVYAALAHHRADALRTRIRELQEEARKEGASIEREYTARTIAIVTGNR